MNPADLFDHDPEPVVLKKGDALFHEGEQPDCMYVLLEGTAEVLVGDTVVESATKGALFGEMALVDSSPRAAKVVATSPCQLAKIDQRRFQFMVQQTPNFATHVMKVLARRLRQMNAAARAPFVSVSKRLHTLPAVFMRENRGSLTSRHFNRARDWRFTKMAYAHRAVGARHVVKRRNRSNRAMELATSRRPIQLHVSSPRQFAATGASSLGAAHLVLVRRRVWNLR